MRIIRLSKDITDCVDCGDFAPGEWYLVHNSIWDEANGPRPKNFTGGCLCIGCLEKRLGRQLNADDFQEVPMNEMWDHQSPRFKDRLSRRG